MDGRSLTGIIPGIILIFVLVGFFMLVNNSTNKSSSNYNALKDYMSADNIKTTLSAITQCGISNYEIIRDDSLDTLDGDDTLGFRLKSTNYNAIMYIKNGSLNSIRFADNDLYRNNTVIKKLNEIN